MNTLAVVAQKGGAGKTMLVVHFAVCAARHGLKVGIIDLDEQGSAYSWNMSRPENERFSAAKADSVALPGLLEKATAAGIDLTIIDTAPHSSHEASAAARLADFVLIPCRPQRFDLESMANTVALLQATKTPLAVVLNAAPQGFRMAEEARTNLLTRFGVVVVPDVIHQAAALSHAVIDGRSVHEYDPKSRSAAEIEGLYQATAGFLDLQAGVRRVAAKVAG
jgi:chromosome partitioning protein